jgi:hypothetical protein
MLHACFTPIDLCFVYTSWHFYAFFGTNLLTRCHSASFRFVLFLYFRKVIQEIFSELDETKAEFPILLTRRRSPKGRRRPARRRPHHGVARSYVSNVSIIFDAPCLFMHHLPCVLLHFVAFLCIFQN